MRYTCCPRVWGPSAWVFLHTIAQCYPERPNASDIQQYTLFFLTLPYVLPCVDCQSETLAYYSNDMPRFQRAFTSRTALMHFVADMHNAVNRRLGKPEYTLTQNGTSARKRT